jgi:tellurite methyltransferase
MPSQDQWNERFRDGDNSGSEPDPFLVASVDLWDQLPNAPACSAAADLAAGAGRNAIYLAAAGFNTTAIDFAEAGLALAQSRASDRGLSLHARQLDLEAPELNLGTNCFDLITVFNFLHRPLFAALKNALKPGGLVVYKTYTVDQLPLPNGPRSPSYVLQHDELRCQFADYRVLRYEERTQGEGTAAIVAQKPQ